MASLSNRTRCYNEWTNVQSWLISWYHVILPGINQPIGVAHYLHHSVPWNNMAPRIREIYHCTIQTEFHISHAIIFFWTVIDRIRVKGTDTIHDWRRGYFLPEMMIKYTISFKWKRINIRYHPKLDTWRKHKKVSYNIGGNIPPHKKCIMPTEQNLIGK